jgi:hypothetical protein
LEIGFNPDIVKIHPDNSADIEVAKLKYGTKMLGGYLGTDEFVKAQLSEHLNKLRNESLILLKYPDVQGRYLLFKHCYMPKPIHLLRTTRPDLTAGFVEELEKIHLLILESLFRYQVKPALFNLLSLSTGLGGIGIQKICEIRPAAYAASYLCFLQRTGFSNHINRLRRIPPADLKPREHEFIVMANSFKVSDGDNPFENIIAISKIELDNDETLQSHLYGMVMKKRLGDIKNNLKQGVKPDLHTLSWLTSLQTRESGIWLDAIPKLTSLLCIWFMVVQRMLIAIIFIQLWLLNWIACVSLLVYGVQENLGMHFEKIFLKINVGRISQSSIRNADALDSASNVIHIGATITSSLEGSEMYQPVPLSVKKAQQKGRRAEEAYKKKINKYQGIWEEGRRENPISF